MHKPAVSRELEREVIQLYEAGWNLRQVSEILGSVSFTTVRNVLIRNGVPIRPRKGGTFQRLPDEEFARTRALYESGLTMAQIGRLLDRTHGAIVWRLERAGVSRRPRADSARKGWITRRQLQAE